MSTTTTTKKRKRTGDDGGPGARRDLTLTLSSQTESAIGPTLACFPDVRPPQSTLFSCYKRKKLSGKQDPSAADDWVVAGESETMEYFTDTDCTGMYSRYLVLAHNKRTNKVVMALAPLHVMTRQVKALKSLGSIESNQVDEFREARNRLGEAFGTKKAQKAIRAAERNKVDVSVMESISSHLQDSILDKTAALPTKEQAKAEADSNRLVPPYHADASDPMEIYALNDIVSQSDLDSFQIAPFSDATNERERISLLPFARSDWIRQHMYRIFAGKKPSKKQLRIVCYISSLMAFRKFVERQQSIDPEKLRERLSSVPHVVVDAMLTQFTEASRNNRGTQSTTSTETKLLTHMFALCLRLDNCATDSDMLARDLAMTAVKAASLFKSLGCKVEKLTQADIKRLEWSMTLVGEKRAILKVPLEFPKPKYRRKK